MESLEPQHTVNVNSIYVALFVTVDMCVTNMGVFIALPAATHGLNEAYTVTPSTTIEKTRRVDVH